MIPEPEIPTPTVESDPDKPPPRSTSIAWISALLALGLFELWTLFNNTQGDTLSEAVWWAGWHRPVIGLVAGMLMGHFFGQGGRTLYPFLVGFIGGALFWTPYRAPESPAPGRHR